MPIKLELNGFDDFIEKIEKASSKAEDVALRTTKEQTQAYQAELKAKMKAAKVDQNLIDRMPEPSFEIENDEVSAKVGYKKGKYDPKNPSDGYKVIFLNYGTPNRPKERGQIIGRGFINKAKKNIRKKWSASKAEALKEILKDFKK